MILNHFTTPENALLIGLGGGLRVHLPAPEKNKLEQALQTMGQPVVWLTKQESNIATAADVAHFNKEYGDDHHDQKIGAPMFGGPVCCTVEVERTRHVMRWVEFLRTTPYVAAEESGAMPNITGRDMLRIFEKAHGEGWPQFRQWWISLKPIPAVRVWVPMTRAQGIEACDWHVKTHPDAEARERFQQQRDHFAALDDGTLILLHDGKGQLLERKAA
jgi:hypothetical protein